MAQFTYYSVQCSDYLTLFGLLMHYRIPFEWHSKTFSPGCYADFYLKDSYVPFDRIVEEAKIQKQKEGKEFEVKIISKYNF